MKEELSTLHSQGTWSLLPLPHHKNLVGCKLVFKIKKNVDGSIRRYKARLVVLDPTSPRGVDPICRICTCPPHLARGFLGAHWLRVL